MAPTYGRTVWSGGGACVLPSPTGTKPAAPSAASDVTRRPILPRSKPSCSRQLCRPRKKVRRDRLMRLAERHTDWLLGFEDEVWFSRLALPSLHVWQDEEHSIRLVE